MRRSRASARCSHSRWPAVAVRPGAGDRRRGHRPWQRDRCSWPSTRIGLGPVRTSTSSQTASRTRSKRSNTLKKGLRDAGARLAERRQAALGPEFGLRLARPATNGQNASFITQPKDKSKLTSSSARLARTRPIFRAKTGDWEILWPFPGDRRRLSPRQRVERREARDNAGFREAMSSYPTTRADQGLPERAEHHGVARRDLAPSEPEVPRQSGESSIGSRPMCARPRTRADGPERARQGRGELKGIAPAHAFRPVASAEGPGDALFYAASTGAKGMLTRARAQPDS